LAGFIVADSDDEPFPDSTSVKDKPDRDEKESVLKEEVGGLDEEYVCLLLISISYLYVPPI